MTDWPTIIAVVIASAAVVIAWRVFEGGRASKETSCTARRNADAYTDKGLSASERRSRTPGQPFPDPKNFAHSQAASADDARQV